MGVNLSPDDPGCHWRTGQARPPTLSPYIIALARIIHERRSEAVETEGRRGFSQVRATQAYPQWYGEETEREKPRRTRGSAAAVGVYE